MATVWDEKRIKMEKEKGTEQNRREVKRKKKLGKVEEQEQDDRDLVERRAVLRR